MRVADSVELDGQVEWELRILSKRRRVEARVQQRACVITPMPAYRAVLGALALVAAVDAAKDPSQPELLWK